MKTRIWISFDLGVRGDYESMYEFLDSRHARECGDGVATLDYEFESDLPAELEQEMTSCVTVDRKSRIYVIFKEEGKLKGRFLVGRRKQPPWSGFATSELEEEDSGE